MATIITHPIVPIAMAMGMGKSVISGRLLIAGCLVSLLPDADVVTFALGIPYASEFGHRGFTHSICFGLGTGLLFAPFARILKSTPLKTFVWIAICTISHAVLDALTNGGLGVAFYWPISEERFFLPWPIIEVSPIGIRQFFTSRGLVVFLSELQWVWMPWIVAGVILSVIRKSYEWVLGEAKVGRN